jgi:HD-GYP domain-containing protein (c-di-GMP phosphodiesterase class II)
MFASADRTRSPHVRPYKPAWSVADAEAEVRTQAGRHFDPPVVDAFFGARSEPRPVLAGALL